MRGRLSDDAVGKFVADNFEVTYQKVGTFRIVGGAKQGGNVASYFCLTDGTVIHAVAGPLGAKQYLQELRWRWTCGSSRRASPAANRRSIA